MALFFTSKTGQVDPPVFLEVLEVSQGAALVKVDARLPTDLHTIFEGTPIATTATAGVYKWMKSAILSTIHSSSATATRIVIRGPNPFKIGDYFAQSGIGAGSGGTITAVAATYVVTAQTKFDIAKGAIIYQAAAANATAPFCRPYALLRHPLQVRETDGVTCYNVYGALVHRGTAATSVYKWGYTADVKNRLGDRIRFQARYQV